MPTDPAYDVDFRRHPEHYQYQSGEQGVFKVEPYKSELLPLWRYKNEPAARASARALYERYEAYKRAGDFIGMDMARKYLQMGFTRAMRYAKYPGGRKRDAEGRLREPQRWADASKREAAVIFRNTWQAVLDDPAYQQLKEAHLARYGRSWLLSAGRTTALRGEACNPRTGFPV